MRLLADENVHGNVVRYLREQGFTVEWIKETSRGTADEDILKRVDITTLILVTNDSDFGALIFDKGLPAPFAILYTRLPHRDWKACAERVVSALTTGVSAAHMTTLTPTEMRSRAFPDRG